MDNGLGAVKAPPCRRRQIEHNIMRATNVESKHDKFIKKIFGACRWESAMIFLKIKMR